MNVTARDRRAPGGPHGDGELLALRDHDEVVGVVLHRRVGLEADDVGDLHAGGHLVAVGPSVRPAALPWEDLKERAVGRKDLHAARHIVLISEGERGVEGLEALKVDEVHDRRRRPEERLVNRHGRVGVGRVVRQVQELYDLGRRVTAGPRRPRLSLGALRDELRGRLLDAARGEAPRGRPPRTERRPGGGRSWRLKLPLKIKSKNTGLRSFEVICQPSKIPHTMFACSFIWSSRAQRGAARLEELIIINIQTNHS